MNMLVVNRLGKQTVREVALLVKLASAASLLTIRTRMKESDYDDKEEWETAQLKSGRSISDGEARVIFSKEDVEILLNASSSKGKETRYIIYAAYCAITSPSWKYYFSKRRDGSMSLERCLELLSVSGLINSPHHGCIVVQARTLIFPSPASSFKSTEKSFSNLFSSYNSK